jgi:hypothetical protein
MGIGDGHHNGAWLVIPIEWALAMGLAMGLGAKSPLNGHWQWDLQWGLARKPH